MVPKLSVAIKNGQCEQLSAEMRKREKELLAVKPINTDKIRARGNATPTTALNANSTPTTALKQKNSDVAQDEKGTCMFVDLYN